MSKYADVDRLEESEIEGVSEGLFDLDCESVRMTGLTIAQLAAESAGFSSFKQAETFERTFCPAPRVAVIPVTSGYGLIGGFAQTVSDILSHVGADAFVTEKCDVAGIEEAYRRRADMAFLADDYTFTAIATAGCAASDNGEATGRAFACALAHMGVGDEVLVLGAGPVGTSAVRYLLGCGFAVSVYDTDPERLDAVVETTDARRETAGCVRRFRNILDATNAADFITCAEVTEKTRISAPGIPVGPTAQARSVAEVFHNPLELGCAAMYFDCLHQLAEGASRSRGVGASTETVASAFTHSGAAAPRQASAHRTAQLVPVAVRRNRTDR
jgi:pyrrolysine biosynthesis protein PylD